MMSSNCPLTPPGQPCDFCRKRPSDGTWHTPPGKEGHIFVCAVCATQGVLPKLVADAIMNAANRRPHRYRLEEVNRLLERFQAAMDRALWLAALHLPESAGNKEHIL